MTWNLRAIHFLTSLIAQEGIEKGVGGTRSSNFKLHPRDFPIIGKKLWGFAVDIVEGTLLFLAHIQQMRGTHGSTISNYGACALSLSKQSNVAIFLFWRMRNRSLVNKCGAYRELLYILAHAQ